MIHFIGYFVTFLCLIRNIESFFNVPGAELYLQCDNIMTKIEYTHYNGDDSLIWSSENINWPTEQY